MYHAIVGRRLREAYRRVYRWNTELVTASLEHAAAEGTVIDA